MNKKQMDELNYLSRLSYKMEHLEPVILTMDKFLSEFLKEKISYQVNLQTELQKQGQNYWREDEVSPSMALESVLKNAPNSYGGFFCVRRSNQS